MNTFTHANCCQAKVLADLVCCGAASGGIGRAHRAVWRPRVPKLRGRRSDGGRGRGKFSPRTDSWSASPREVLLVYCSTALKYKCIGAKPAHRHRQAAGATCCACGRGMNGPRSRPTCRPPPPRASFARRSTMPSTTLPSRRSDPAARCSQTFCQVCLPLARHPAQLPMAC